MVRPSPTGAGADYHSHSSVQTGDWLRVVSGCATAHRGSVGFPQQGEPAALGIEQDVLSTQGFKYFQVSFLTQEWWRICTLPDF